MTEVTEVTGVDLRWDFLGRRALFVSFCFRSFHSTFTPLMHLAIDSSLRLPSGAYIPQLGYGVYQARGEECVQGVASALRSGYRHSSSLHHTPPIFSDHSRYSPRISQ